MNLLVIAYPQLSATDLEQIEDFRRDNDKMFSVVRPHFTLVFPVTDLSIADFASEIKKQVKGMNAIRFSIHCSATNKDAFNDSFHAFLIPGEGFNQITKLHDKLYSDKLSDHLRPDLDFIPHISIGNSTDKMLCKKMADDWNLKNFTISGFISTLDIVNYENETVTTVKKIKLKEITRKNPPLPNVFPMISLQIISPIVFIA